MRRRQTRRTRRYRSGFAVRDAGAEQVARVARVHGQVRLRVSASPSRLTRTLPVLGASLNSGRSGAVGARLHDVMPATAADRSTARRETMVFSSVNPRSPCPHLG